MTGKMARGLATGGTHDKQLQWGYLSAHHSHNKVLEDAFERHQAHMVALAESKARESQETEEAMWQQELENRRRRRIAQEQKRELQDYIKKQIEEQRERRRVERESWKSLAPLPPKSRYGGDTSREFNSQLETNMVPGDATRREGHHHNGAIISGPTMYDMDAAMRPEVVQAREDLKRGLLEQITSKKQEEELEKEHNLEQERRYLEHVRMEAEEQRLFQRMKQQVAKRDLMESWNRDIQLKELLREKEMAGKLHNRRSSRAAALSVRHGAGVLPAAGDEGPPGGASGTGTVSLGAGLPPAPGAHAKGTARGFLGTSRKLPGGGGAYMSARSSSRASVR